ncbi:hypothetical protein [Enemella dayhoffiae]|nr:hypothetical protein [Enemella dayhoffiae]
MDDQQKNLRRAHRAAGVAQLAFGCQLALYGVIALVAIIVGVIVWSMLR